MFFFFEANDDKEGSISSSSGGERDSSSGDDDDVGSPSGRTKQQSKQGPSSQKSLRDSGCFEEDHHLNSHQPKTKGNPSKISQESSNNLDSVGKNIFFSSDGRKGNSSSARKHFGNLGMMGRMGGTTNDDGCGGGGGDDDDCSENVEMNVFINHSKVNYQPNIPVGESKKSSAKDFLEQTREVLDRTREIANHSREILERTGTSTTTMMTTAAAADGSETSKGRTGEETCETNAKLTMVKYVVGGYNDLGMNCESGNVGFSEKSSDSGVSSSSMSSANFKDKKLGHVGNSSPKCSRLESSSPKKMDRGKIFSPSISVLSDAGGGGGGGNKSESLNPFVKNSKCRSVESSRSNDRSDSKSNQEMGSPKNFKTSSFTTARSLLIQQKKT